MISNSVMYTVFIVHTTPANFRVINAVAWQKLIPDMEVPVSAAYLILLAGCINPDHLTRGPVKKTASKRSAKHNKPAKLGSNLMLMYAMSSHACRRQVFSTCSVDRCCCEYITMDMLPTEHEVSIWLRDAGTLGPNRIGYYYTKQGALLGNSNF